MTAWLTGDGGERRLLVSDAGVADLRDAVGSGRWVRAGRGSFVSLEDRR
jgi:hypothetical protein